MLFMVFHEDKDDALALRLATRSAHLAYVKDFKILFGGPTLENDLESMNGSLIIVDLPDLQAADAFVANDPYTRAGLFKRSTIKPVKQAAGPVLAAD